MHERYQLMNRLFQLILADQAGLTLPEEQTSIELLAKEVLPALEAIAARTVYTSGGNKHEIMVQLAKLYTAGIIQFHREKGGEFVVGAVKEPNAQDIEEFNDNIKK